MKAGEDNTVMQHNALAFQRGDEKALAFFYSKFHPALSLYANRWVQNRSIAEEIASTAFIKVWKMHHKLDSYGAIQAYLYKIVLRDCQRTLKQERKRTKVYNEAQLPDTTNDTPFDNLVRTEVYRIVHAALKSLAPGSQKVLTMHYLDGKTTGEIARELHLSPSTIKTQKSKGLEVLRKTLLRPISILLFILLKVF
ncbi:MAG TPA: sigma-70 family RNA polymerase sigma factor [Flavisolibacter sp.]|nr:sigma-70 family RNA polymerase sigma factor [Flavisolibacter sp.]